MNKLIAIIYSVLILFQSFNVNLEDISKFKALMEHAEFHQENYGDSFLDFLDEHYGNKVAEHDNNHDEHKDLPFKHNHQTCTHTTIVFTFETIKFDFTNEPLVERLVNFFYKESTSLFEKPSVFQPPKLA
ncbi:hypothetical protein [Psychroserpens sp.]|uniref:hypothetical protein n=1 Tax=Psychroserpens sp. TaxID=2020870 RepID=UPI002B270370|nr:hypothetical protein [Psychroserpens sp.]